MIIFALEDIRSVYNVGSIFRTGEGFGFNNFALVGITPTPLDKRGEKRKDFHKTALGAEDSVSWEHFESTEKLLENYPNFKIISIEICEISKPLGEISFNKNENYIVIFGSEVNGIKKEILEKSDNCFYIPMSGQKESFNVSVTAGIVLYEIKKQLL